MKATTKNLLFVFLLIVLTACNTTTKTIKNDSTIKTEIEAEESKDVAIEKESQTTTDITLKDDVQIIIKEYDTDKQVDPGTGLHPVKKEILISKNTEQETKQTSIEKVDSKTTTENVIQTKIKEVAKNVERERVKTDQILKYAFFILVFIGLTYIIIKIKK